MTWGSKIFCCAITDQLNHAATYFGQSNLSSDTFKVDLYGTTPDAVTARDDTSAHNCQNGSGGQWVSANEVTATGWPAGGISVPATISSTFTTGVYTFKTTTNATGGSTDTVTNAFGCLIYSSTVAAHPGVCMLSFGGANSVTSGTFTVAWNASGIFTLTF